MGIETDIREIKQTLARLSNQGIGKPTKKAKAKPKLSVMKARQRLGTILQDIGKSRRVSVEQFGNIAEKHGMTRSATGTLYAVGYVKKEKDGKISLTEKGKKFKQ